MIVVDGLGRIGPAEAEMAGVEAQAEERGIDRLEDPRDLVGGLDVRPGVGMEDRLEALAPAQLGGPVEVVDQGLEAGLGQPGLGMVLDPARERPPVGLVEVIGQDGERSGIPPARRPGSGAAPRAARPGPRRPSRPG